MNLHDIFIASQLVKENSSGGGTVDAYTKSETDTLLADKANITDVYSKTETDTAITNKVAEIVAGAPEDFDTLKEMSDWIASHEESAAAMNSDIQTNASNISALQDNKVDKVTGKSLVSDTEITRLANVDNYDDTAIKADIATNETNISNANTQIADIFNRCTGGKNLIDFKNLKYARSGSTSYNKTDDSITVTSNNSWASVGYCLPDLEIGKQYKLSFEITNFSYSSGAVKIRLSGTSGGTGNVNKDVIITADGEYSVSFTVTDSNVYKYILFYPNFSENSNVNSFTCSNLMLKFAESGDDTYVPYVPTNAELYDIVSAITNGWTTTTLTLGASTNIDLYFVREDCQVVMHYNDTLKKVIIDINFKTKDMSVGNGANFVSLDAKYIPSKKIRSYISTSGYIFYATVNPETNAVSIGVSSGSVTADTENSIRLEWTII